MIPCKSTVRADYTGRPKTKLSKQEAHDRIRPSLIPILDAGHEITLSPGVVLRKLPEGSGANARSRYFLIGKG